MGVNVGGVDGAVMDLAPKKEVVPHFHDLPGTKVSGEGPFSDHLGHAIILRNDLEEDDFKWEIPFGWFQASLLGTGYVGLGHSSKRHLGATTYGPNMEDKSLIKEILKIAATIVAPYGHDMNVTSYKPAEDVIQSIIGIEKSRHYHYKLDAAMKALLNIITALASFKLGRFPHFGVKEHYATHRVYISSIHMKTFPFRVTITMANKACGYRNAAKDYELKDLYKKVKFGGKTNWFEEIYDNAKLKFVD